MFLDLKYFSPPFFFSKKKTVLVGILKTEKLVFLYERKLDVDVDVDVVW